MNDINTIMNIVSYMTDEKAKQVISSNNNIKKEQLDIIESFIKVIDKSKKLTQSERLFVVEYIIAYMRLEGRI